MQFIGLKTDKLRMRNAEFGMRNAELRGGAILTGKHSAAGKIAITIQQVISNVTIQRTIKLGFVGLTEQIKNG